MGLREAVERRAVRARTLRVYAPNGSWVSLDGEFLCLPRLELDALLVRAAVAAGAELLPPMSATTPLERDGRVIGARFRSDAGERELQARVTLLATGANATVLAAFGLAAPSKPNAVAGRAYFKVPAATAAQLPHLSIVYQRSLCPGYGWIFPGPDRRYNVGVGLFTDGRTATPSLHVLWERFLAGFAPARELV
jgi:flavin-dependent dehydrogenase